MKNRVGLTQHLGINTQDSCTAQMHLIFRGLVHFNPICSQVSLQIQCHFHVTVKGVKQRPPPGVTVTDSLN